MAHPVRKPWQRRRQVADAGVWRRLWLHGRLANGSMDTCIALRTPVVKDGTMYVQAGGGVVADSDPEAEFKETVHKSAALFRSAEEAQRFAGKIN